LGTWVLVKFFGRLVATAQFLVGPSFVWVRIGHLGTGRVNATNGIQWSNIKDGGMFK
jgi:hypothetical protein